MRPVSPRRTPAARARAIAASWGYFLPPLTDEAKDGKAPEVRQTASPVRKTKPPEEKPKDLNAELFEAVKTEDAKAIAELVGNGAEVDARNSSQKTALMYAAEKGKIGIAEMLIENGADLKAADGEGRTALMLAIVFNRSETVKMLISKGADVNAEDSHQRTPLILAAGRGNIRTVEMLISNGADVNAEDEKGRTALDVATNKGHAKIAKMLEQRLKHEAKDAGATPAAGVAAPKPAADSGEVKPEPKEAEAKPITELFIPNTRIYSDIPEARPSLLEELRPNESEKPPGHKAKPPPPPRRTSPLAPGRLPKPAPVPAFAVKPKRPKPVNIDIDLLNAAYRGDIKAVEELIAKGADINAKGYGGTVLMYAVRSGKTKTVEVLISKRADLDARDRNGWTALMLAADRGKAEIIDLLIKNGANVSAKANDGRTATELAAARRHNWIAEILGQHAKSHEAEEKIQELFVPRPANASYSDIPEARPSLLEELRPNESEKPLGHKAKPPPHPRDNGKRKSKP